MSVHTPFSSTSRSDEPYATSGTSPTSTVTRQAGDSVAHGEQSGVAYSAGAHETGALFATGDVGVPNTAGNASPPPFAAASLSLPAFVAADNRPPPFASAGVADTAYVQHDVGPAHGTGSN
jgi:hypothetical protein